MKKQIVVQGAMKLNKEKSCCCSDGNSYEAEALPPRKINEKWIVGEIHTSQGAAPIVSTTLNMNDTLGAWKVRWGIGRMDYTVEPGLYAIGNPDQASPILVSANYKLTFDSLRKELTGINCWLLILDTKGINVWCAAGKGTFGTNELVKRISKTRLSGVVSHRTLILPQLGASGISAYEVTKQTGFSVIYGPVRAKDIKAFLNSGFSATEEMRTVKFSIWDRLVLTPVELVAAAKTSLMVFGVLFLINLFAAQPFVLADLIMYSGAVVMGTVLTPVFLPFIPGKAFAWKGWLLGLFWTLGCILLYGWFSSELFLRSISYLLVLPSYSAYLAMNFTGSSTYTSFSGVIKEMKAAVPFIVLSSVSGIVLFLITSLWA